MNFQNIPRDNHTVKRAFVPKRGAFSFFDYVQIEPRMFAYYAARGLGDTTMADWYREGRDVYTEIASSVYKRPTDKVTPAERQMGKVWFLMSLYGAGPKKISAEIGIPYAEAKEFYLAFHEGLPQIKALSNPPPQSAGAMRHWEPGLVERTLQKRRYLTTPWGRRLHPEQWGEHKMLNKLIQGSAADLMKLSIIRVDGYLQALESKLVLTVHDEIGIDGPVSELSVLHEHVPALMRADDFITEVVPIDVDHEVSTTTWADKTSYKELQKA